LNPQLLAGWSADELSPVSADRGADDDGKDAGEDDETDGPDDLAHGVAVLAGEEGAEGDEGEVREHYIR